MKTILISKDNDGRILETARRQVGSSEITRVAWADIKAGRSLKQLAGYFRNIKCDGLVMGVSDLTLLRKPLFHKVLLMLSRSKGRCLVDADGKAERVSWISLVFKDVPVFAFACLSAVPLVALTYAAVWALGMLPRKCRRDNDTCRGKSVAYLRIHFFNTVFGGTLAHTHGVIQGFEENGYDVVLLCSDKMLARERYPKRYRLTPPSLYRDLPEIQELAYNFKLILAGRRILKRHRPGLIYQRHHGRTFAGLALARLLGVPLVLEFNSSDYQRARLWNERSYRLIHLLKAIETLAVSGADLVVVVSEPLKRLALSLDGTEPARVLVQPNGVNTSEFTPDVSGREIRARLGIPEGRVVVGFMGSIMPYMGIDVLIDAAIEIGRRRSSGGERQPGLHLLIVGDGGLRADLEDRAESKVPPACPVHFTGAVPFTEVKQYMAACDVLVSPHNSQLGDEDFYWSPIKLFEYMAMGKAIVASRVGQIAEVLTEHKDARLVPPGDVEALADALIELADDPQERQRLGANARLNAVNNHTWQRNVRNILARIIQKPCREVPEMPVTAGTSPGQGASQSPGLEAEEVVQAGIKR
jgi:glycosyltransferase involved in cell wall biosynthesis